MLSSRTDVDWLFLNWTLQTFNFFPVVVSEEGTRKVVKRTVHPTWIPIRYYPSYIADISTPNGQTSLKLRNYCQKKMLPHSTRNCRTAFCLDEGRNVFQPIRAGIPNSWAMEQHWSTDQQESGYTSKAPFVHAQDPVSLQNYTHRVHRKTALHKASPKVGD